MRYAIEVKIDGYASIVTDCYDNEDFDKLWAFYEELCDVEETSGSTEDFDAVLGEHGCTESGAGILYNSERQGFYIQEDDDGRRYVAMNGIEYEIVNDTYVPNITTSFAPAGFWSAG